MSLYIYLYIALVIYVYNGSKYVCRPKSQNVGYIFRIQRDKFVKALPRPDIAIHGGLISSKSSTFVTQSIRKSINLQNLRHQEGGVSLLDLPVKTIIIGDEDKICCCYNAQRQAHE